MVGTSCPRCGFTMEPDEFICDECRGKVAVILCDLCGALHSWIEEGPAKLPMGRQIETAAGQELHTRGCPNCISGLDHIQVAEFGGATIVEDWVN